MAEAVGLGAVEAGKSGEAAVFFRAAKEHYESPQDKLRQDLNVISIDRLAGQKDQAVRALRMISAEPYGSIPEAIAAKGWLDILDPPAPPPAIPPK